MQKAPTLGSAQSSAQVLAFPVMCSKKRAHVGYADMPTDMRRMFAHAVIEQTRGCYRAIARQLCALHAVDREACNCVWRLAFERSFGAVPGAQDGNDEICPHLLGVNTWREALMRTYKALHTMPPNDAWMWEGMNSWSRNQMDARLAQLGTIPSGALADLLRARGASILRHTKHVKHSQDLVSYIIQAGTETHTPAQRDAYQLRALRLIDVKGANPAYAEPTGHNFPALHHACMGKSAQLVRFLLGVGAKTLLNWSAAARTPLMLAKEPAIWHELLKQGADPNHFVWGRDQNDKPVPLHPLTLAARYNQPAKVKALLVAGADPDAENGAALWEARKHEKQSPTLVADIEQYMQRKGGK